MMKDAIRVILAALNDWWNAWTSLIVAVTIWLLAQGTILFGPPATFGLYVVAHALVNGEEIGFRGMLAGARKYFGLSWAWGAINLLVIFILYMDVRFYGSLQSAWGVGMRGTALVMGAMWLLTQFYALPLLVAAPEPHLWNALRTGFFAALAFPLFSLLIFAFAVMVGGFSFGLVFPIFLGLPVLIPLMGVRSLENHLVHSGLRAPEKSPLEVEREQAGQVFPLIRGTMGMGVIVEERERSSLSSTITPIPNEPDSGGSERDKVKDKR